MNCTSILDKTEIATGITKCNLPRHGEEKKNKISGQLFFAGNIDEQKFSPHRTIIIDFCIGK